MARDSLPQSTAGLGLPASMEPEPPEVIPAVPASPRSHPHAFITAAIKRASSWEQLALELKRNERALQTQNHLVAAAAITRLAQLGPGPRQPKLGASSPEADAPAWDAYASYEALLQQLLQMAGSAAPHFSARQVSNVMWAAQKLSSSYTGGHPLCRALIELLLPRAQETFGEANAQELSIW